jgi:GntR family transcriptional regulator/MocR family aminotransferase
LYLDRRGALLNGLASHCDGHLAVHNADAGLHVTTLLPAGVDDCEIVRHMSARGLTASEHSTCYAGPTRRSGLLLGFGGFDEQQLEAATQTLGEVLRAAARREASGAGRSGA